MTPEKQHCTARICWLQKFGSLQPAIRKCTGKGMGRKAYNFLLALSENPSLQYRRMNLYIYNSLGRMYNVTELLKGSSDLYDFFFQECFMLHSQYGRQQNVFS